MQFFCQKQAATNDAKGMASIARLKCIHLAKRNLLRIYRCKLKGNITDLVCQKRLICPETVQAGTFFVTVLSHGFNVEAIAQNAIGGIVNYGASYINSG